MLPLREWRIQAERDVSEYLDLKTKHIPKVAKIFLRQVAHRRQIRIALI